MKLMALKDQTDDLLSKENVKDAAMFGAEFIPGVGEALAIKRTSDALDKKDYLGAGIEATAGLLGIIPGVGDLAGKSLRVATKGLRKADIDEANTLIKDDAAAEAWKKENKLLESQRQQRVPEVQKAAEELKEGKITSKEYRRAVTANQPIKAITKENFPDMPTKTEIVGALKATDPRKVDTGIVGLNKTIPDGTRVGSRLDIPSYDGYDKWIVSLHDGTKKGGNAIGYGQTAVLKDVEFVSSAKGGLNIATGKNKATIARIHGDYINAEPENVFEAAKKLIDDPEWTQVGMNPFRHSYFYNKATGTPVTRADEVIQVGPLVLAKGVKKPTISELKELKIKTKNNKIRVFNEGGAVMQKQMDMIEDGGLMDEGGTVDPVSGNDVPPGSTQEEVRDDIPAQLSEGEFVFPADVVRYIGLGNLMRMRQEAKLGLRLMEEMGQMGNSDEASMPDDMPFDINDLDMEDEPEYNTSKEFSKGGVIYANNGTYVQEQAQPQFGISGFNPANAPTTGFMPTQPVQAASQQFIPQPITRPAQAYVPVQQTPTPLPTFGEITGPGVPEVDYVFATFRNEAGQEIQLKIKKGSQGELLPGEVLPDGYSWVDPTATETEEVTTTPTTVQTEQVLSQDELRDRDDADAARRQADIDRYGTADNKIGLMDFYGQGKDLIYGVNYVDGFGMGMMGVGQMLKGTIGGGDFPEGAMIMLKNGDDEILLTGEEYTKFRNVVKEEGTDYSEILDLMDAGRKAARIANEAKRRKDDQAERERERGERDKQLEELARLEKSDERSSLIQTLQEERNTKKEQKKLAEAQAKAAAAAKKSADQLAAEARIRAKEQQQRNQQEDDDGPSYSKPTEYTMDTGFQDFTDFGGSSGPMAKGGLASKPKPKKRMKRGGLASKK